MSFFKCPQCEDPLTYPWPSGHSCLCGFWVPYLCRTGEQGFDPENEDDVRRYEASYTSQVCKYLGKTCS